VKFRKKPVVIEAIQWDGTWEGVPALKVFCKDLFERNDLDWKRSFLWVKTLEGEHLVSPGDWIIKGVKNEFYPCKNDIFQMTYEPVE
jgi:hypothetical protein